MVRFQPNKWAIHASYYTKLILLYSFTVFLCWYALSPATRFGPANAATLTRAEQHPYVPIRPKQLVVSGIPVRITIPGSSWDGNSVDLTVIPGYYDASTDSWTLSGYDAQFAMISALANNVSGQTFIYGHNNDYVFGALRHVTPTPGEPAFVYTSDNHIFEYTFVSSQSIGPNDVSILNYNGPSTLLIQTCTGSLNEWRTEYKFAFYKVVQ